MDFDYQTLLVTEENAILKVQHNRDKDTNSFSRQMTLDLMDLAKRVQQDVAQETPQYRAMILTGGVERSFSVGGDFRDVSVLETPEEVRAYLGEIIDLYISILNIHIPVIAAIDNYAIGQGLQVALMTDWRIGTEQCQMQMPELKNGVSCPLGSIILEQLFGRAKMLEFVMDCEFIDSEASKQHGLLSQRVTRDSLLQTAHTMADKFGDYPRAPFVTTKKIQNDRFVAAIESVREDATLSHIAAALKKSGEKHFNRVLGK